MDTMPKITEVDLRFIESVLEKLEGCTWTQVLDELLQSFYELGVQLQTIATETQKIKDTNKRGSYRSNYRSKNSCKIRRKGQSTVQWGELKLAP